MTTGAFRMMSVPYITGFRDITWGSILPNAIKTWLTRKNHSIATRLPPLFLTFLNILA